MRVFPRDGRPVTFLVALLASLGIVTACSSETSSSPSPSSRGTSGTSGTSSPPVSTAECERRCTTKLGMCGAPAAQSEQGCAQLCGGSVTEAQAACFESKDCEEIARAESVDELCPPQSSGSSGSSGTTPPPSGALPTTLTIRGDFGSVKAVHASSDGKIASSLSVGPEPKFSPSTPSTLPDLSDKGVTATITSPDPGACEANVTYTLNATQLGLVVIGVDTLPATACATFTDAIAKDGFKAKLSNVPYPNSTTKATVTIELSP